MNIRGVNSAEYALGFWTAELILGGTLTYIGLTYAANPSLLIPLATGFGLVQLAALGVWFNLIPSPPLTHSLQALVRLAFLIGTTILIALFAPFLVKASLVVLVPAYFIVGYMTDFIWYETTIAP